MMMESCGKSITLTLLCGLNETNEKWVCLTVISLGSENKDHFTPSGSLWNCVLSSTAPIVWAAAGHTNTQLIINRFCRMMVLLLFSS